MQCSRSLRSLDDDSIEVEGLSDLIDVDDNPIESDTEGSIDPAKQLGTLASLFTFPALTMIRGSQVHLALASLQFFQV